MAGPDLRRFLADAARRPFAWGSHDCLLFLANWVREVEGGRDPAEGLRRTYENDRQARKIILQAGGIQALVESCLAPFSWSRTKLPQHGDVGLARVPLKPWRGRMVNVPAGAIMLADRLWAVKPGDGGLVVRDFPIIVAWTRL